MLSPGTTLQNRYRITRELGRGGMGAVYEAIDQRLTSKVALKEMLGAGDVHARNAFEREAALLANLNHANLPRVMDHFSENDGAFLVMQFIEGMDLAEWLDLRGSPFPQAQVLLWADTLLDVLEYLHGHNPPILHRDIKPSNIKRTEDGRLFLLDFGLAKGSVGQMPTYGTTPSVRGGTPYYSPLEQFSGPGTDGRSDLYALGATLYHLISGVLPADAGSRHQAIEDEEPDPLQTLAGFASPNVASVIERAMSPSRKHRFDSASEMRRALKHAAEEDERARLKDEYRRAEERRRHRDEERKKAAEDAARQVEQERQRQEAETRRKEALEQQKTAALRQEELERRRYEDAERQQREKEIEAARLRAEREAEEQRARLPSTIPPPALPTEAAELSGNIEAPRAVVTTIPGPPPERLHTNQDGAPVAANKPVTMVRSMKRAFAAAAGIIVLVIIISAIVFVYKQGTGNRNVTASTQTQPQATPQSNSTASDAVDHKPPNGMVYVPGGTFMMGRNESDGGDDYESPAHSVTIKPFFIDIYEVTNEDYENFVKVTNHKVPQTWSNGAYPTGNARKPVTGVTWDDANDYARWVGKKLPTEEEWEFAARGEHGRLFPWGNKWLAYHANTGRNPEDSVDGSSLMANVGTYKDGKSEFGAYDMIGNAWEWTSSDFKMYSSGKLPEGVSPALEPKTIRGGCWATGNSQATTTLRRGYGARGEERGYSYAGFRLVQYVPDGTR